MRRAQLVAIICLIAGYTTSAQDQRVFNNFFMNPYVYNPAYAGVDGHSMFFGLFRTQYMGIDGAPQLAHVNFHTPLKNNLAFGALAYNESEGPLITSGAKATLGYFLEVDKSHYMRFGLSLGGGYTSLDPALIDVGLDPALQNLTDNSFITADVGITYHFDQFNVGLSLPNLISRDVISSEGFSSISVNPLHNMTAKINYRGHINDNISYEPHIVYRFSTLNLPQYEIATIFHLLHITWAGVGYRQDAGFVGFAGIKVKENFGIGFAYEVGNSELNQASSGTAEVNIGYHIPEKKKHHSHSHSFFKSHKISKEQRRLVEERRQRLAEERQARLEERREEARLAREAAAANKQQNGAAAATGETSSSNNQVAANTEGTDQPTSPTQGNQTKNTNDDGFENSNKEEAVNGSLVKSVPIKGRINRSTRRPEIGTTHIVHELDGVTSKVVRWSAAPKAPAGAKIDRSVPVKERINTVGKKELGFTYQIKTPSGVVPKVLWAPAPKTITDARVNESIAKKERVNENGTKEIGTTYVLTLSDGTKATEVRWAAAPAQEQAAENQTASTGQNKPTMVNENTARKGHHILELPVGHHVVAAQFKDFQEAEDYSDRLFERGFHGTIVGYVSAIGEYFVVVHKGATPTQAAEEQAKWKKLPDLDHVYIFNVVE